MTVRIVATPTGSPEELAVETFELPPPAEHEVQVEIRAAGMNPADWGMIAGSRPRTSAQPVGFEGSGIVTAVGSGAPTSERPIAEGDEVIVYLAVGSFASAINVPADTVFPKPANLDFPSAANLFLVGLTAAELLALTGVVRGETLLVHGASGATGVSLMQQARSLGVHVIGTASERNFDLLRRFGAEPVAYGPGLEERLKTVVSGTVDAAVDSVGTEEAFVTSVSLVEDPNRIVSIANPERAARFGVRYTVGSLPESAAYRAENRLRILEMAERGDLIVPVARTFPLSQAAAAFELLNTGHPGGKLALIP